jgi:DNA-binding winged helix-turn-helix (wHTH) protein/TolB-like protein/Tfp pilus assembly protein PilF
VRFGPFEFELSGRELSREGQPIRLQEQPSQILAALLERPGEVATRDDLRQRLWSSETFVDFEHGLNTAIKKVRQALGDSAESPQYIETLARRGYRFIAPVERLPDRPGETSAEPAGRVDASRRQILWTTGLLVLILITAVGAWLARRAGAADPPRPVAQVAVLPFRVVADAADVDLSYIGVGLADAITTRLANVRQILLRPTSAVLRFKDAQSDTQRIAAELGVAHLLLGTIQPVGETYRLTVQLVRADGVAIWGRTYDEPRAGLLQIQDHIAEQIVSGLHVQLSPPERARLHLRYTEHPAAYDLYLRGRVRLVNYTQTSMTEAIDLFEQALALDGKYALARAALATAAAWFSVRYAYYPDSMAWGKRAETEARLALAEDPALADAHLALASAAGTLYGGFNWSKVLEHSATALALDPSIDLAHIVRMRAYYHLGRFDRTREEAKLAKALNPSPNIERTRLEIAAELFGGEFAAAAEHATLLMPQTDTAVPHYLGLARYYTGDVTGARAELEAARRGDQPDLRARASLASIEAAIGLDQQARSRVRQILAANYMDHHVAYSLGAVFAQLHEFDEAVKWLRQADETGFSCLPWFERDPLLDPLRKHPGFERLVAEMRQKAEGKR